MPRHGQGSGFIVSKQIERGLADAAAAMLGNEDVHIPGSRRHAVITSYSIHYTKLYELSYTSTSGRRVAHDPLEVRPRHLGRQHGEVVSQRDRMLRLVVQSYNFV